jgi:hypothetical protein
LSAVHPSVCASASATAFARAARLCASNRWMRGGFATFGGCFAAPPHPASAAATSSTGAPRLIRRA